MSDDVKQGVDGEPNESGESQGESTPAISLAPDLAIALDYAPLEGGAPTVVAKGQGWLAAQIIAIAEANGIEVKKDPDLAQLLATVDVDSEIPLEAFAAVAEILSYVYRLNEQWPDGMEPEPPAPEPAIKPNPEPGADP